MHIPDGFLGGPVAAATWVAGAGGLAIALRAERRERERVPAGVLGALAAFVFAAQMVNVPVAPGTSGHLVGATLVALLVGPWRAVVVMAVVLALQATLLQDGGLTAYGANLMDMGLAGALVGASVASLVARLVRGYRGVVAGAVFGAFVATVCGAVLTALWLAASGLYPFSGVLPLMLVTHTAIGVLEGALTGAIVATLLRWRPDLVSSGAGTAGVRPGVLAAGVLGVALEVAAFVAPFASRLPDGLEHTALALGFAGHARPLLPATLEGAPFLRGALARVAPLVAGVVGTLLAALVAWLAGRGLSRADHVPHA
jgi:cobalt/nickel transport system permease protein